MQVSEVADRIGQELAGALEARGWTQLTRVQEEVLDPALEGRDLRISSQTGSGKTVAIGFAVRDLVRGDSAPARGKDARPRVLVVVPTRELAKQVEEELSWLFAPLDVRVASVTGGGGGGGYREELRAFRAGPAVVVGTPGRLRDHLERGAIDTGNLAAVVLDEADRMLDLGFREDIEAILDAAPEDRRTHLVSATFPREVAALADRVQRDPVRIEATPLGEANADIEHVIHLVRPDERLSAIVNLLLASPGAQALLFARTRADVADLASALGEAGFVVGMLSGEMEQPERLRALGAFKAGRLDALVATDVAARGIDVADVTRVIHVEPPSDPDAYTHRSGRTGRAGKKGTSSVLVAPSELVKTSRLLARARVRYRLEPVPSADAIRDGRDERLFAELTADGDDVVEPPDARSLALAERLASTSDIVRVLARLVARARRERCEPRKITPIEPPAPRRAGPLHAGMPLPLPRRAQHDGGDRLPRDAAHWVRFQVSWGGAHGADPRRLVAMLCRRGGIDSKSIGAIRVERTYSVVEVAKDRADDFERATKEPDPRDPRVKVRRWSDEARAVRPAKDAAPPRAPRPAKKDDERPRHARAPRAGGGFKPPKRGTHRGRGG
jgi:ATP-dependent RNA helicase DeaD